MAGAGGLGYKSPIVTFSPMERPAMSRATALLAIDAQQALTRGRYATWEAGAVVARIRALAERARAVGAPVIFVQHESAEPGDLLERGSEGWQLDADLQAQAQDWRVAKRSSDAFHQTDLASRLRAAGVRRLVVCGMQSEFCVDSTVRQALVQGFDVLLVQDAHTTLDSEALSAAQIRAHENATLPGLDSYAARVSLSPADAVSFDA